jgi:hypothetical protein
LKIVVLPEFGRPISPIFIVFFHLWVDLTQGHQSLVSFMPDQQHLGSGFKDIGLRLMAHVDCRE